ncbi:MAG: ABC transporter substrate-binding protein [Candidatus Thorarchaeota archaeon]
MQIKRKDIYIISLSFCLLITSGLNIWLLISSIPLGYIIQVPPELETLVVGTRSGPHDLDPTDSWDSASNNVIEQVAETLFTYDTRQFVIDETMPRVNWLATGYSWDPTDTILTVNIKTGVRFHDGTLMDAAAVAWNFNRFMYLMNHTGELPSDGRAVRVHSLYEFPDGIPIFESVVASDADTVVFTLTAPYAPILDAMCYISCGILSPASTPATQIIHLSTGDIIGTGPYMYDYYITDTEVRFTKFDDYWATDAPYNLEDEVMFDAMVYSVIDDPTALNYAMLIGDIDILFGAMADLLPAFRANPWIKVYDAPKPGLVYQYLSFNVNNVNLTWRKAMSYAINYTYIIEEMLEGRAHRAYGAISPGYGAGFNHWLRDANRVIDPTNGSAVYNLTTARSIILTDLTGDSRIDPRLQANDTIEDPLWLNADLVSFNYSYNTDNWFRADSYVVLKDWFDDIGIDLIDAGTDWAYFILYGWWWDYESTDLYILGWSPDHMDPFNMLDPLFSNISVSNYSFVNDPWVMGNLSLALETTDDAARNQIYWDIQWRLFAELYVHAPIYHSFITSVHGANLYDVEYDVMGRWWALPVKRNITWVPEI